MRAIRKVNSRANGSDPQPPMRWRAIARRISERRTPELRLLDRRCYGNFIICVKISNALAGDLHSHLQDPELVPVKANEDIALGLQIVEPYFRRLAADTQIRDRQRKRLAERKASKWPRDSCCSWLPSISA